MIFIKILYLTISYTHGDHTLYNDLVDELLNRKHEVSIVRLDTACNKSSYKMGKPDYLNIRALNTFSNSLISKGISTLMMGYLFKYNIKKYLSNKKFDLVIYATPPITFNSAVKYCRKHYNCKSFLMLKDIFPQNAVDLEMFGNQSIIYKFFKRKEKSLYKVSDFIGCMSQGNIDYLLRYNTFIDRNKVFLFPNSIKLNSYEISHDYTNEDTTFIFGGNLGKPQYISGLLELIDSLKDYSKARFIICGKGTEEGLIKEYLSNPNCSKYLTFYDFLPTVEYNQILSSADVGILSLDPRFTIPNIPSRLQGYMLLKKPIFAFVDSNTDIRKIIQESDCGWYSCSDNIVDAKTQIMSICEHKDLLRIKGQNGYDYLLNNFDVKNNVDLMEDIFEKERQL